MPSAGRPTKPYVDFALGYAARGWPVHPLHEPIFHAATGPASQCSCGGWANTPANVDDGRQICKEIGKHPRLSDWPNKATTNADQIRKWWSEHPTANIGVLCGEISGILALDVDEKDGGPIALKALEAKHTELPFTTTAKTGGGGFHFIWEYPGERRIKNKVAIKEDGKRILGLDVRSNKGYILVAPSLHRSGQRYEWVSATGQKPVPAPTWLLDLMDPPVVKPAPPSSPPPPATIGTSYAHQYAETALRNACKRIQDAGEGQRHDTLVKESYMVGGFLHLLSAGAAHDALVAAGVASGKSQREVERVVSSGLEQGALAPRTPPELEHTAARQYRQGPHPADTEDAPPPPGEPAAKSAAAIAAEEERAARLRAAELALASLAAVLPKLDAADRAERARLIGELVTAPLIRGLAYARLDDSTAGLAELAQLRAVRGLAEDAKRLDTAIVRQVKAIREAEREANAAERAKRFFLGASLLASLGGLAEDSGAPEELLVPFGYEVTPAGTYSVRIGRDGGDERERICHSPLFISALSSDIDGQGTRVVLRWHDGNGWRSRSVARKTAMVARSLAEESDNDVPVSSVSASPIVEYLEAFVAVNTPRLPVTKTSTVLGWRDNGFLWGTTLIGPDGPVVPSPLTLNTEDPGIAQLASSFRTKGTFEDWQKAIEAIAPHPRLMLALYASVCPPLLKLVADAPNFLVDWSGETSQGKTTALRVAASVWGYPHDRDGLIRMWDATTTYVERASAFGSDLPMMLDDSKRAKPAIISKIIYAVAQGAGRGRGTVGSVQVSGTWRTVLLSTGEAPLTSYSTDGGAAARCLTLWGSPFGGQSTDNADLARETRLNLLEHHGHLGPRLLAWLQKPEHAEYVLQHYRWSLTRWAKAAGGNAVAERAAGYVALLEVAQWVAEKLGAPKAEGNPLLEAWRAVGTATETADRATLALRELYAWAVGSEHAFIGRHYSDREDTPKVPPRGWYGAWRRVDMWDEISFIPLHVKERFQEWRYDYQAIVTTWRDRGWLRVKPGGTGGNGLTMPIRLGSAQSDGSPVVRCLCVRRAAIDLVDDRDAPGAPPPAP